jgi:subtilisin family serine protease
LRSRSRSLASWAVVGLTALLVMAALPATPTDTTSPTDPIRTARVIVRARPDAGRLPERAVTRVGGDIGRRLDIINGFVADVPARRVDQLASAPGILSVTPDSRVRFLHHVNGYDAKTQPGSLYNTRRLIGALDMADRGYTGRGIDIALIDSGVAPVTGLNRSGQVVHGPDLSFEAGASNLEHLDTFGHGTHMAGLMAGRDGSPRSCLLILCSGTDFQNHDDLDGVAPEARIVSIKVANALGATDVSQVIAAIDWVVQHRRDDGLNIRVLNLSFGTDGVQDYRLDPLAYAAEVAWHKGIVVVAAAGNAGYGTAKLNNPAYDPYVIAVGAANLQGTTTTDDDVVPEWSSRGNTARRPDVVAPGQSIASYRVVNSYIDQVGTEGRVNYRLFKGTGTSQAAAVVSGSVALLLDQRPSLTPDQVKAILTSTAKLIPGEASEAQGAGTVNLFAARTAKTPTTFQTWERATGTGSLELARGSAHVVLDDGELNGEQDARGYGWDGNQWSSDAWAGTSWTGGSWSGNHWSGGNWNGNQWSGNHWSGNHWSGNQWSGDQWSGNQWSGNHWSGNHWSNDAWSGFVWK